MDKYVVSSSTTFHSKVDGKPFTVKHYFTRWIFGEGLGMSLDSVDKALRMNFAKARKLAKYHRNCAIEVAPEFAKAKEDETV